MIINIYTVQEDGSGLNQNQSPAFMWKWVAWVYFKSQTENTCKVSCSSFSGPLDKNWFWMQWFAFLQALKVLRNAI